MTADIHTIAVFSERCLAYSVLLFTMNNSSTLLDDALRIMNNFKTGFIFFVPK